MLQLCRFYLSGANFAPESAPTAEIAVTMWFIEGHVMFQIRGGQNEPTHELPFATAKAHMCAHVMGNIGKQGCPLSGDGGRGCMQGCAQPLINIGVRSLCKILHLLQNLDVLVLASILLSQDLGLSY